jgi:diacylglycerol O-acyltransferase
LKDGRSALIFRLHHCLADGIAGVGIMNVLMDSSPVIPHLPRRKPAVRIPVAKSVLSSLTDGCVDTCSEVFKRILDAMSDVSSVAERFAANGGGSTADEFEGLFPEITAPTERLRFNVLYRGPQKFAWAQIPLHEIKEIKNVGGASVNDVILALVTATIRRYLEMHGDKVKGRLFRMMVPVNLRGCVSTGEYGNRISLIPVTIPLDIRDPRKLLEAVHKRTEFLKRTHAAELVSLAGGLVGVLPYTAQAVGGHVISRLPFTPFNMVCTNVPGPQFPLYLLGRKMLHCYPYVPIGGEMALNCAILTYNGTAYFGFSGEIHAVPDLKKLESLLKLSFTELREALGTNLQREKDVTRKKKIKKVRVKPTVASTVTSQETSPAGVHHSGVVAIPPKVAPIEPALARVPLMDERTVATRAIV